MSRSLLTLTETADRLGLDRVTLWRWRRDGMGPKSITSRDGTRFVRYREADVEAWLDANTLDSVSPTD